jgi:hypothetical protein
MKRACDWAVHRCLQEYMKQETREMGEQQQQQLMCFLSAFSNFSL